MQSAKESFLDNIVYWITVTIIRIFFFGICPIFGTKVEYKNLGSIPKKGRLIFVCTHESYWDILLLSIITWLKMRFIAKVELFKGKIVCWWLNCVKAIPLDREKLSTKTIRMAYQVIKSQDYLAIFPEGTRSKEKDFSKIQLGTAMIALSCKCKPRPTIVLVAIRYSEKKGLLLPRHIVVKVGAPIPIDQNKDEKPFDNVTLTEMMAFRMKELYDSIKL